MAEEVVSEVKRPDGTWMVTGRLPVGQSASMSSYATGSRQVYLIGWLHGEGPGVWRSELGVDAEIGPFREITTAGFEQVADLDKEHYELDWRHPDKPPLTVRIRAG